MPNYEYCLFFIWYFIYWIFFAKAAWKWPYVALLRKALYYSLVQRVVYTFDAVWSKFDSITHQKCIQIAGPNCTCSRSKIAKRYKFHANMHLNSVSLMYLQAHFTGQVFNIEILNRKLNSTWYFYKLRNNLNICWGKNLIQKDWISFTDGDFKLVFLSKSKLHEN